jgi:hypothetical protein
MITWPMRAGTAKVQEAIALGAVWASQKIMEQSRRWQQQIKPAHNFKVSPEIKARPFPLCAVCAI